MKYLKKLLMSLCIILLGSVVFGETQYCLDHELRDESLPGIQTTINRQYTGVGIEFSGGEDLTSLSCTEHEYTVFIRPEAQEWVKTNFGSGTTDENLEIHNLLEFSNCGYIQLLIDETDSTYDEFSFIDRHAVAVTNTNYIDVYEKFSDPSSTINGTWRWMIVDISGTIVKWSSDFTTLISTGLEPFCEEYNCNGSPSEEEDVDGDTLVNSSPDEKDIDGDGKEDGDHENEKDTDGDGIINGLDTDIDCDGFWNDSEEEDDKDGDEIPDDEEDDEDGDGEEDDEDSDGEDDEGEDAGGEDEGGEDAGGEDAGGEDAGGEDAGGEDAGGEDAGGEDAGGEDAGGEDAGGEDAGGEDTGGEDTGGEDTGGDDEGSDSEGGDDAGSDSEGSDDAGGDDAGGDDDSGTTTTGNDNNDDESGTKGDLRVEIPNGEGFQDIIADDQFITSNKASNSFTKLVQLISTYLWIALLVVFMAMLIYAGFTMLTSGGDTEKFKKGLDILMYVGIGMGVALLSYVIINIVVNLF